MYASHPFQIGEVSIYSYGVMISLALLVAALALFREAPREGINPDHVLEAIIVAAIAGLAGARLLYVALNFSSFSGRLLEIFFARFEGLSFYGAFIGGVLGLLLWVRWRKVDFFKMADLFAPYLALGYAFGRVGCFLNGCCYGKFSEVPWALPSPWAADNLLHHPVQLCISGAIIIFVILKLRARSALSAASACWPWPPLRLFAFYHGIFPESGSLAWPDRGPAL